MRCSCLGFLSPLEGGRPADLQAPLVVELLLWGLPLVLLVLLLRSHPRGARSTWWLLGAGLVAILLDKAFDLQTPFYNWGQALVRSVDPELRLRGEHLWLRNVLLGGMLLAATTLIVIIVRKDRAPSLAKALALAGLFGILAFLVVRLQPHVGLRLRGVPGLMVECVCLTLIFTGMALGLRQPPPCSSGTSARHR